MCKKLGALLLGLICVPMAVAGTGTSSGGTFDVVGETNFLRVESFPPPVIDEGNPLRACSLCLRTQPTRGMRVENQGELPATVEALFADGNLKASIGGVVLLDLDYAEIRPGFDLGAFDQETDFEGESGTTFELEGAARFDSITTQDPTVLAYIAAQADAGLPVEVVLQGTEVVSLIAPGNVLADADSEIRTAGQVIYD